jgi:signal transduction histidine kinase/ActR/RegA family two-component response regulator
LTAGDDTSLRVSERDSIKLLELAQEIGGLGISEWQVASGDVWLSPKLLSLYGLNEFDGRYETWHRRIFREDRIRIDHLTQSAFDVQQRELSADFRIQRAEDGSTRWIERRSVISYDSSGKAVRSVGVSVDVTEQKRAVLRLRSFTDTLEERVHERTRALEAEYAARRHAEDALRQVQKMEAVGQLTGGIAHDFNNLLTIILGGLERIDRLLPGVSDLPLRARITQSQDLAMQGVTRAAALTRHLLAFSRQQALAPAVLDANKLVSGVGELLRRTLGEAIALETVQSGGLWPAFIDANQLENVLLNLAVNARDAMPDGGKLTIETANTYLDDTYVAGLNEPVRAGQYVLIAVTDTGHGMSAETLLRVFEPFFTTKPVGEGTGLGLSQVFGFVHQSLGHVGIYSELGEGTTVKLYLPRHHGIAAQTSAEITIPAATGEECILVVEDEEALRRHAVELLEELGYKVLQAANGADGLVELERHGSVNLLFTDVVMPGGMNGRQLADEALRRQPALKVLFTTGYTRNAIVHQGRLDAGIQLLSKPYSFQELAAKIRLQLDDLGS